MQKDKNVSAIWDERRLYILSKLSEYDANLAAYYTEAINRIDIYVQDDTAKAQASVIGHCLRELINSIPSFLNDGSVPLPNHADLNNPIAALYQSLRDTNEFLSTDFENQEYIPVPVPVIKALNDFYRSQLLATANSLEKASFVVSGNLETSSPAIYPWKDSLNYFVKIAHFDRAEANGPQSKQDLIGRLELVEEILTYRFGHFFSIEEDLEEIIERANEMDGKGQYIVPTDVDVRGALSASASVHLAHMFYRSLKNPLWIDPLARQKAFKHPAGINDDGTAPYWSEAEYLARMAPLAPNAVTAILVDLVATDNPYIREKIIEACEQLPEDKVAHLADGIKDWAEDNEGANAFVRDSNDLADIINKLLGNPRYENKGMILFHAFFTPKSNEIPSAWSSEPKAAISDYAYREALHIAISALPPNKRYAPLNALMRQYRQASFRADSIEDLSWIWRPSIAHEENESSHIIGNALVDELLDVFNYQIDKDAEHFQQSLFGKSLINQRIAIWVLTQRIERNDCFDPGDTNQVSLFSMAAKTLNSNCVFQMESDTEFYPLARAYLARSGSNDVQELMNNIISDSSRVLAQSKQRFIELGRTEEGAATGAREHMDRWKHRALSLIGADLLPSKQIEMLDRLNTKYGEIQYSESHFSSGATWIGPTSPLEYEELKKMDGRALIHHLSTWHPNVRDTFSPSHEGQARIISKVISENPSALESLYDELMTLRPTYIRAVLSGWRSASDNNEDLPWSEAMKICCAISTYPDDAVLPIEGDAFDDDGNYRNLKYAALGLIESMLKRNKDAKFSEIEQRLLLDALLQFSCHLEPDKLYEDKYGGDNMDALTLSLNTIRPMAIRLISEWIAAYPDSPRVANALNELDEHIDHDPSLSVAAALGSNINHLLYRTPSWLKEHREALFGREQPSVWQQVVITTALATFQANKEMFELLRPSLIVAIEAHYEYVIGWKIQNRNSTQMIGDWILMLLANGTIATNDPLAQSWFSMVDPQTRGTVMNHLCWMAHNSNEIPESTIMRIERIWEERITYVANHEEDRQELSGIHWLAMSPLFSHEWWGSIMAQVYSFSPDSDGASLAHKEISELSLLNPEAALSILESTVADYHDSNRMHYHYIEEMAIPIISNALATGLEPLVERAKECLNKFGYMGSVDMKKHVEDYQNNCDNEQGHANPK